MFWDRLEIEKQLLEAKRKANKGNAFNKIKKLSNTIFDINPDVKEFKRLNAHYGTRLFSVETAGYKIYKNSRRARR